MNLSRRPFKKRSHSNHIKSDEKMWFFNENDNYWYTPAPLKTDDHKSASSMVTSMVSAGSSEAFDCANTRLRLNDVYLKNLTLIELKYLKQICFNKLQKMFEATNAVLCSNSTSALVNSSKQQHYQQGYTGHVPHASGVVRLASIPKDESMKTVKTKNISHHRSKSVDFKFFDDIKESYFFKKKDAKDASEQVFGQSLYKCILNDIKQSTAGGLSGSSNNATSAASSSKAKNANSSLTHNSLNLRWRARNKNNLVIASKFDLNLMNNFDILTNNELNGVQR